MSADPNQPAAVEAPPPPAETAAPASVEIAPESQTEASIFESKFKSTESWEEQAARDEAARNAPARAEATEQPTTTEQPPATEAPATTVPATTEQPATTQPAETPTTEQPPDVTARLEAIGGAPVLDLVQPLFEPAADISAATTKATAFVDGIAKYDPLVRDGLANALFDKFKDTFTAWIDQDRGMTAETLAAFEQFKNGTLIPSQAQFPQPGAPDSDGKIIVTFPDVELDLSDPFHKEVYEGRKFRFEAAQREQERTKTQAEAAKTAAENQKRERVTAFGTARGKAFDDAYATAAPNFGDDPDLQFLNDFAKTYTQWYCGQSPEAQKLAGEALDIAQRGGTGAEAKAAKIDFLMRQNVAKAVENINKLIARASAKAAAATATQPAIVPGATRTGEVARGNPPEAPATTPGRRRFSFDDPESFAQIQIPE